jgi:small subunit ribosomal protein S2
MDERKEEKGTEVSMADVTMKELLEAGVHFGHETKRWDPRMKPYIFGARNGIYIIDLQKTVQLFRETYQFVRDLSAKGEYFVGTKKQAQNRSEEAGASHVFVNQRWLRMLTTSDDPAPGGTLKQLEAMKNEDANLLPKKEIIELERGAGGKDAGRIKNMDRLLGHFCRPQKEKTYQ